MSLRRSSYGLQESPLGGRTALCPFTRQWAFGRCPPCGRRESCCREAPCTGTRLRLCVLFTGSTRLGECARSCGNSRFDFWRTCQTLPGFEDDGDIRLPSQAGTATGAGLPGSRPVPSWPCSRAQPRGRRQPRPRSLGLLEARGASSHLRDTSKSRVPLCTLIGSCWQTAGCEVWSANCTSGKDAQRLVIRRGTASPPSRVTLAPSDPGSHHQLHAGDGSRLHGLRTALLTGLRSDPGTHPLFRVPYISLSLKGV